MKCIKCGCECSDNVRFCKHCGNYFGPQNSNDFQTITGSELNYQRKETGLAFVEDDEHKIDEISTGYFTMYAQNNIFGRNCCILTNKRLYFTGKNYTKHRAVKQNYVIELDSVTSAGFTRIHMPLVTIILSLISTLVSALGALGGAFSHFMPDEVIAFWVVFGLLSLIAHIVLLVLKRKAMKIDYGGNSLIFIASGSYERLLGFTFNVHLHRSLLKNMTVEGKEIKNVL